MDSKYEYIITEKSKLNNRFRPGMGINHFVLGQGLIKPLGIRQFSSSSILHIDEDTDHEPKTESIEEVKKRLDDMREKIDELEKIRFTNRIDKTELEKAKKLTDYIQDHNEMLTYYLEGEIKYTSYETQREVSLKLQEMGRRIKHYEDEAFEIYFSPKEGQYPDREALHVLNKLNRMMRIHLMYCRDKVYGTPLEPTDSINPYKDHNKELFKELERQRDLYLHQTGLAYIQEDAKRIRREKAEEEFTEKQAEFEKAKGTLDKLVEQEGGKKVKFVDDVPKDISSSSTTPEKEKESSNVVPAPAPEKEKGKAKESLIDDFADPNMEMPDYIDPDG